MSCQHEFERVLQCCLSGLFHNIALLQNDGSYKALFSGRLVHIHPSSVLFQSKAEAVMYGELVLTTRSYMRNVSRISAEWIPAVAPHLFGQQ
jgi:HrpA-like RNA helicase